jgi:hypothetical protein
MSRSLIPVVVTYTTLVDPAEMARRGRLGAAATHAKHDGLEITAAARAAFLKTFERQVDPEQALPVAERRRLAEHARRAHMQGIARRKPRDPASVAPTPEREAEHAA